MSVNFEKFKRIYYDPKLKFFYKLLPEVKNHFKTLLKYLEKSLTENDKNTWFGAVIAMQSVAEDMCFDRLKGYVVKMNEPNRKNFKEIERMIGEILLLGSPPTSRKKWYNFWS
jgi:hypothetical protein